MEKGDKKITKIQNLLIYFFLCSFFGWILEIIYAYMVFGTFVDRGFLYGPMCPIYGYGAIIMIIIAEEIKKKNINIIGTFFIITAIFTILEYMASLLLEMIFNLRWWDYTNEFLNLNGRVCLMFSLFFGIVGIFFIEKIYEPSKKIIQKIRNKIPSKVLWIILIIMLTLYIGDTIYSFIQYINLNSDWINATKVINMIKT